MTRVSDVECTFEQHVILYRNRFQGKPNRAPTPPSSKQSKPDFGQNQDGFSSSRGQNQDNFSSSRGQQARPDQIEQMFGFPAIQSPQQANDSPSPGPPTFADLPGRQVFNSAQLFPMSPFGQFPLQTQNGFANDQSPFIGFPQQGADRFEGFSTTPAPKARDQHSGGSQGGQSRPDFGESLGSRPELFGNNPNRLLELGAQPTRPDIIGNRLHPILAA